MKLKTVAIARDGRRIVINHKSLRKDDILWEDFALEQMREQEHAPKRKPRNKKQVDDASSEE